MPNVLILGGTGYLGLSLGQSLLRSGNYSVWGLARTAEKAKLLTTNEINPVVGDVSDPATITSAIAKASIDVVIDATSAYEQASTILKAVIQASKARRDALTKEGAVGPKLGFVYTSGSWVHGSPKERVSDLTPVGNSLASSKPATAVSWRPGHEQAILAARDTLNIAILRPGAMYGRTSWVWGTWWGGVLAASKSGSMDAIQVPADCEAVTGCIHVDDVVSAFHAAVDRIDGLLGAWPVFDLVGETISIEEIMGAVKEILKVKAPLKYAGTHGNPFLEALSLVSKDDASRARIVMGWQAKRTEFLLNMPVYVKAWAATQEGL